MTKAVCIQCGAAKDGALVACPACGFVPRGELNQAKALMLCDRFQSQETLTAISESMQAGEPLEFDEAMLDKVVEGVRRSEAELARPAVAPASKATKEPSAATRVFLWLLILLAVLIGCGFLAYIMTAAA